ncbi:MULTISPECIES: amino acid deaminase [Mesorhizobium]|uniref:Amino acid deaminase n=1 Tax=Mesorhizobium denitrificans TaxID=2294114 RepID=A0A371XI74_9HYPH|nr:MULTISPECIES: amino acid deaminase [Mesorhizobium]RFC68921.1 amino acid deaminase [Mesorhizobium denitrificans]
MTKPQANAVHAPRPWEAPLTSIDKGAPALAAPVPLSEIAAQKWNVLAEDLPLPAAVIRQDALLHNSQWMRNFLDDSRAFIAPHGKTTMAPALFDLQIADGAWGITVATPHQFQVAAAFGYKRIFMANQVIGRRAMADIVETLNAHPDIEFFCLVDDLSNAEALAQAVRSGNAKRPLNVLVELGYAGGRTGCRTVERALALARKVHAMRDALDLAGIEGFEGLIKNDGSPEALAQVGQLLDGMVTLAETADNEGLFSADEVLLSAGGSAYYDVVARKLGAAKLARAKRVLIRSGCYITHDSVLYARAQEALRVREPALANAGGGLQAALEIWAYVQSRPEPGKAIIGFGKRDISYDDLPLALKWFRPGMAAPSTVPTGHTVLRLNDQHCHLEIPENSPLVVGDMIGFGISHPCLTFDKWRVMHLVDENYQVTASFRTYF